MKSLLKDSSSIFQELLYNLYLMFFALFNIVFGSFLFFSWVISGLPEIEKAESMNRKLFIRILDKDGQIIGRYGDTQHKIINAKILPKHIIWAIVDTEDKDFFKHNGISLSGIARALISNLKSNKIISGGSSITQQLAKNILQKEEIFDVYDRSMNRKIKEMFLALKLEKKYTKWEILTLYLNRVYFGGGNYGIEAASQAYFDKKAENLNLYEAAWIMGMLKAPSRYSQNSEMAKKRVKNVLMAMLKNKHINKDQMVEAIAGTNEQNKIFLNMMYFTDWVIRNIPKNIKQADIEIHTTVDSDLQKKASDSILKAYEEAGKDWNADQGSMVVIDKTGAVRAMVGGLDYKVSRFNRAYQSKRSVGSFFKYFVYFEAIKKGLDPDSFVDDGEIDVGVWSPSNYLHKSVGKISIRQAFSQSVNSSSVMVLLACGINNVSSFSKKLGISSKIKPNPSIVLGGVDASLLELCSSLLPILNRGYMIKPYCITEIRDANSGELLYSRDKVYHKVASEKAVWHIWDLMKSVVSPTGTGRGLIMPGKTIFGKTGTSNKYADLTFVGGTSEYIFGAWFGRDDNKEMQNQPGRNLPIIACRNLLNQLPNTSKFIDVDPPLNENSLTLEDLLLQT